MSDSTGKILARIQQYLAVGGFFNPEAMEHDKVRTLIIDSSNEILALATDLGNVVRQRTEALRRLDETRKLLAVSDKRLRGYIDMRTPGKGKIVHSQADGGAVDG